MSKDVKTENKSAEEKAKLIEQAEQARKAEAELVAKEQAAAKAKAEEAMAAKKKADEELSKHFVTFYLSKSRYLQQPGDAEPKFVEASPEMQVPVVLPAKVKRRIKVKEPQADGSFTDAYRVIEVDHPEDAHLKRAPQLAPRDVRPGLRAPKAAPAHVHFAQPVLPPSAAPARAADK